MKLLRFLMFNGFVKLYLNSNPWFLKWNRRVKSTGLELWYTLAIFFPYFVILMIPRMFFRDPNPASVESVDLLSLIPFSILMIALVNKDFFNGQSVVHRLLGYQVVDIRTNMPASKVKCMLRNVTAPLWPIEVIFILTYPKRRLGDFIAGTALIDVPASDPELILNEFKSVTFDIQTRLTLLLSVIWIVTLMILFDPRFGLW
ncbi:MAG: hypothetical protein U0U09_05020 [Cyclobacteriaceae bacterium]